MVTVKCFASLREELGVTEMQMPLPGPAATVGDVLDGLLKAAGRPLGRTHLLAAVNMTHAAMDVPVRDGDEVAFFPPVTGGAR